MKDKNQRRQYLVNRPFQLDVIKKFSILATVNIITFYFIIYLFFYNLESKAKMIGLKISHPFLLFLSDQKSLMTMLFIIVAIINVAIIICTGIFISHKVAGPIYRLVKFLNEENLDGVKKVSFRKGDYFLELQDAFNNFFQRNKK